MVKSMKEIDWMTWSFCDKENQKRREREGKNFDWKNPFALSPSNQLHICHCDSVPVNFSIISTEDALRWPMTYDNHPSPP